MSFEKELDCVKMKRDIQAQMQKEYEGLSLSEMVQKMREELAASDDPLARKWKEKIDWDKTHPAVSSEEEK